jgi:F0F1-type ATP synthase assembly protein I
MSAESRWRLPLRIFVVQLALTVAVAIVWWFFGGSALGALAGGGAVTFLSLWFGLRVLGFNAVSDPEGFLRRLVRAEFFKLLMVVLFFLIAARYGSDYMAEIITGFMAALVGFWFGLWPVATNASAGSGQTDK